MTLAQKIVHDALGLEQSERAVVINLLLQSLEEPKTYESEWLELAEKRRQEHESGKVHLLKWNEVKENVRRR